MTVLECRMGRNIVAPGLELTKGFPSTDASGKRPLEWLMWAQRADRHGPQVSSASHFSHICMGPDIGVVFFWKFGLVELLHHPSDSLYTVFLSVDTRRIPPQNLQVAHKFSALAGVSMLLEISLPCSLAITVMAVARPAAATPSAARLVVILLTFDSRSLVQSSTSR